MESSLQAVSMAVGGESYRGSFLLTLSAFACEPEGDSRGKIHHSRGKIRLSRGQALVRDMVAVPSIHSLTPYTPTLTPQLPHPEMAAGVQSWPRQHHVGPK